VITSIRRERRGHPGDGWLAASSGPAILPDLRDAGRVSSFISGAAPT